MPVPGHRGGGGGGGDDGAAEQRRIQQRRAEIRRRAIVRRRRATRRRAAHRRARRRVELRRRGRVRARRRELAKRRAERRRRDDVKQASARIVEVIDGDTVRVATNGLPRESYIVNPLGLDAPEIFDDEDAECGGREAKSVLLFLGFTAATDSNGDGLLDRKGGSGVEVEMQPDPNQKLFDSGGRLQVYLDVIPEARAAGNPGYDISKTVIGFGYSRAQSLDLELRRTPGQVGTEEEASFDRRGAWGQCQGDFHSSDPDEF